MHGNRSVWVMLTTVIAGAVLSVCAQAAPPDVSYQNLADSDWKPLSWCGYRFVFQPYAHNWGPGTGSERLAHEAEAQQLLTPVWNDPDFKNTHQIPGLHEWAWSGMDERWKGRDKRECYELAKRWYVRERDKRIREPHWKNRYPKDEKIPFTSMTGHGWLVHGPAEWGMDWLGIEIGENIDATQLHIAFQRGAARMFNLPTHADVSQWYGGTVPLYESGVDEFTQLPFDRDEIMAKIRTGGTGLHNGGHSSSSHSRMWYVCWLSGITVLCPEACQSTFFAPTPGYRLQCQQKGVSYESLVGIDKNVRVELSPYGQRAKKFYAITQKHPEIGIPYTPTAVLLDKYSGFFGFHFNTGMPWGVLQPTDGDRRAFDFLNTAFPDTMRQGGTPEHQRLVATECGDTFDVLVTGVKHDLLKMYGALIVLGDHEFLPKTVDTLKSYVADGGELCLTQFHADQLGATFTELQRVGTVQLFDNTSNAGRLRLLKHLRDTYVPVDVSGRMEYLINRTPRGWVVGLVNNEGVTKGNLTATKVDHSKAQTVTVRLRVGTVKSAEEWYTEMPLKVADNAVKVFVPAGEVRIVEFVQ